MRDSTPVDGAARSARGRGRESRRADTWVTAAESIRYYMLRSVDAYTLTGSMKIPRFIPVTYVGSPDFDATQNKKHEDYLKPDELAAYRVRNDSPNIWVETPNDKYVEGIVYFYEQLGDNPNGMVLVRTGDIGDQ